MRREEVKQKAKDFITKLVNDEFFKLYRIDNNLIASAEKHNLTYFLIIETENVNNIETTTDKIYLEIYKKLMTEKEARIIELSADEIKNLIKAVRNKKADSMSIYENKIYIEDDTHNILNEIMFNQELNYRRILINYRDFKAIKKLFKQQIISINDIKNAYFAFRPIAKHYDELFSVHIDLGFAKCHLYICACIPF